jgi:hypothetical protein
VVTRSIVNAVDPAELLTCCPHGVAHRPLVCYVASSRDRAVELDGDCFGVIAIQVRDGNTATLCRETAGRRGCNARAGAGGEQHLPGEAVATLLGRPVRVTRPPVVRFPLRA